MRGVRRRPHRLAAPRRTARRGCARRIPPGDSSPSRYRRAATALAALRASLSGTGLPRYYECGALVAEGVALVASFRSPDRAESLLQEACAYEDVRVPGVIRWVATAYHLSEEVLCDVLT